MPYKESPAAKNSVAYEILKILGDKNWFFNNRIPKKVIKEKMIISISEK